MTGYLNHSYAESLVEFGTPRFLPKSRGWILERQIPGFSYKDGIWCYPLFACQDWSRLSDDLDELGGELISFSAVIDPFGTQDVGVLEHCFHDVVLPFKQHFVIDLECDPETFVSNHHRRNARKALQKVRVERCVRPADFIQDWIGLYSVLISRHAIKGIRAFSSRSLAKQLDVPGMVMFRAIEEGKTVGMTLWYIQGDVGYYHLGAYNEMGYRQKASFALFWQAIERFAIEGLRWLNLGAGAGTAGDGSDGLTRFKRGWANGMRTAYFCGRIFDRQTYTEMVRSKGITTCSYFPAYRAGEFGGS
jgi:hypothetical protein